MSYMFEIKCWLKRLYRQSLHFQVFSRQLAASEQLSSEQLIQYQNAHLQKLLHHSYQNIPYYRDLFRKLNLRPDSIKTVADLERLPFLDKQTVRENYDKLIARNRKNILCNIGLTSGSSGTPGKFLRDYRSINFEHAAVWRQWHGAGDNGKKRVSLRGDVIVPVSQTRPPFWKYNSANKELLMSSYHLSIDNSKVYIDKILEFQPAILYSYPSTAYLLAKFFQNHQTPYQFDAIFTSSETLDPDVRKYIEDGFQTRIFDWYGQAERVVAICQCKNGIYHIQEDYSLVETIPCEQGYELVGTHLHNYVMPLIRYRTQDFIELHQGNCRCGSHFRTVKQILGRTYNYLQTPEGNRISITNHIPRGVENLIETQFYQDQPGEVVLNILTNGRFTEKDKAKLIKNTLSHTSPKMKVIVREVKDIPRGPNGKFINIINKLETSH